MKFDARLLEHYRDLLQNTDLQKSYQEWVRAFRYLRKELGRRMPEYTFQAAIVENAMDYSYFQFSNESLKKAGLKIVAAFCHREFELEVWLSGVNREAQWEWAQKLSKAAYTGQLTDDPKHTDYILRLPVESDLADGEKTAAAVQAAAMKMLGQIG